MPDKKVFLLFSFVLTTVSKHTDFLNYDKVTLASCFPYGAGFAHWAMIVMTARTNPSITRP